MHNDKHWVTNQKNGFTIWKLKSIEDWPFWFGFGFYSLFLLQRRTVDPGKNQIVFFLFAQQKTANSDQRTANVDWWKIKKELLWKDYFLIFSPWSKFAVCFTFLKIENKWKKSFSFFHSFYFMRQRTANSDDDGDRETIYDVIQLLFPWFPLIWLSVIDGRTDKAAFRGGGGGGSLLAVSQKEKRNRFFF